MMPRLRAATFAVVLLATPASAQTAAEHAAHHPDTAAMSPTRAMPLTARSTAERDRLLRDGRARIADGTAILAAGVNHLSTATTLERHGDMLAALDSMRLGIGIIESGIAVRMALDNSAELAPRVEYLRAELAEASRATAPLSFGHVVFMIAGTFIAAAMLLLQLLRVRRIAALRAGLTEAAKSRQSTPEGAHA